MKITCIKAYSIESPVTDWTNVKIETDEPGLHGWGEATLPTKPLGVLGAVGDLKKLLVGRNPLEIRKNWEICSRHSYWRGGPIVTKRLSKFKSLTSILDRKSLILKYQQKPITLSTGR
jgi:galactonate dehydratase